MPYCLYVRKSRADAEAEAHGEGETLTRHINTLLELAKKRRLEVTEIYKEIVSGETIAARPVMQQLLSEVGDGLWDGVLVMEIERLARGDTIDQGIVAQTFKYSGTKIITPMKDFNPANEFDEEYFEFGLFMSRREYKTINRRLQRGRIAAAKEGKYVGNSAPLGYERVKLEHDKGFTLKIIPEQAEIVRMIYELYTAGEIEENGKYKRLGISLIVRRLNELNVPTRKGGHWSPATIRDLLTNPIYIGKIRWNWRPTKKHFVDGKVTKMRSRTDQSEWVLVEGLHPAIIDKETFEKAAALMKSNPPAPIPKKKKMSNPLAGLVVCTQCGKKMVRRPYNNGYPDTLICSDTACNTVSSFLYLVERRVLESMQEWLDDYRADNLNVASHPKKFESAIKIKKKALADLEKEYNELNKQYDSTFDFLERGIYTYDLFTERSKKIADKIKENEEKRAELSDQITKEELIIANSKEIIPKMERAIAMYDKLTDPKEKNDMLKEVLEKIEYTKLIGGRWHASPDDFTIEIYPRLPKIDHV